MNEILNDGFMLCIIKYCTNTKPEKLNSEIFRYLPIENLYKHTPPLRLKLKRRIVDRNS